MVLNQMKNLFSVLIISIFSWVSNAQNLNQVIIKADSLFENEAYEEALLEYQRAIFFTAGSSPSSFQTKTALCYNSLGDIPEAKKHFNSAITSCLNDSLKAEIIFQSVWCDLEEYNFYNASKSLNRVPDDAGENNIRKRDYLLGIAYWELNEFDKSFVSFYKVISSNDIQKKAELINIRNQCEKKLKPRPSILPLLSSIIPGSGQIISGHVVEGLASFILCGGIGILSVGSVFILNSNVVFLNLSPWFLRYYFGGIHRTVEIKDLNRIRTKNEAYKSILDLVEFDGHDHQLVDNEAHSVEAVEPDEIEAGQNILDNTYTLYKNVISPQDIMDCIYYPSCSAYTMETLKLNGFMGILDAIDRLTRCHLFGHDSYKVHKGSNLYYNPVVKISK